MMSIQRQVLIVIIVNVVIGTMMSVYANPLIGGTSMYESQAEYLEQQHARIQNATVPSAVGTDQYDPTYGDTPSMGRAVFDIFVNGINPFSIPVQPWDGDIIRTLVSLINWFRFMVLVLLGIEIYLIIKNRKTS